MSSASRLLGVNIRAERVRHGWTQSQLGERIGLSQSVISDLENGKRAADLDDLIALCEHLGVSLRELCRGLGDHEMAMLGL